MQRVRIFMTGKTLETIYLPLTLIILQMMKWKTQEGMITLYSIFCKVRLLLLNMIKTESINTEFKQHHLNLISVS